MSPKDDLDMLLDETRPTLSPEAKTKLWSAIETRIAKESVPSPYTSFMHSKLMTTFTILVAVVVGTAGTVAASESAKPGDLLFPIERVAERARLALASQERAAELRTEFAEKRLSEIQSIIGEETVSNSAATSTQVTKRGEERISVAVNVLLDLLDEFEDDEARAIFLTALITEIDSITVSEQTDGQQSESRVNIDDDRIKTNDDSLETRYRDDNDDNDDNDDKNDDQDDDNTITQIRSIEAEADVYTDVTKVEVEINDQKSNFTTTATTRDDVVAEIVRRYGVERSIIEAILDFEIENRASRDNDDNNRVENSDSRDDDDDDREEDSREDDSDDRTNRDEGTGTRIIEKFEVEVEDGVAEIKIKYNERELEYEMNYTTRAVLLADVSLKTGLGVGELESVLDFEMED